MNNNSSPAELISRIASLEEELKRLRQWKQKRLRNLTRECKRHYERMVTHERYKPRCTADIERKILDVVMALLLALVMTYVVITINRGIYEYQNAETSKGTGAAK